MKSYRTFAIALTTAATFITYSSPSFARDCQVEFTNTGYCADIEFNQPLKAGPDSPFALSFWKKNDPQSISPVFQSVNEVEAELFMPDMGHGSKKTKVLLFPRTGVASVSSVYFMMSGLWEIRIRLKNNMDGRVTDLDKGVLQVMVP